MGLSMKNLILWGFTEKFNFTKNQYIGGRGLPKNRGVGEFADLKGGEGELGEKEGVVFFERGWVECTL